MKTMSLQGNNIDDGDDEGNKSIISKSIPTSIEIPLSQKTNGESAARRTRGPGISSVVKETTQSRQEEQDEENQVEGKRKNKIWKQKSLSSSKSEKEVDDYFHDEHDEDPIPERKKTRNVGESDSIMKEFNLDAADIAFPTVLRRQTNSRPGAFAHQGIGVTAEPSASRSTDGSALLVNNAVLAPSPTEEDERYLPEASLVDSSRGPHFSPSHNVDPSSIPLELEQHSTQTLAEAEPLDEVLRRRKRWKKPVLAALILFALLLIGLTVGFTLFVDRSVETKTTDNLVTPNYLATPFDISVLDPLQYATYHAVRFGFYASASCQERSWSPLELTCRGSVEGRTTLVILDASHDEIICERRNNKTNLVFCRVEDVDKLAYFEGTVLVACGTNDQEHFAKGVLPLRAKRSISAAMGCQEPFDGGKLLLPYGGLYTSVRGDSFQWLGIDRFCVNQGARQLFHDSSDPPPKQWKLISDYRCEQGHYLQFPEDAPFETMYGNNLTTRWPQQSLCVEWGHCESSLVCGDGENDCQGGSSCSTVLNMLQLSDPQYDSWAADDVFCRVGKDPRKRGPRPFFEQNEDMLWQLVNNNDVYSGPISSRIWLPKIIQDVLSRRNVTTN